MSHWRVGRASAQQLLLPPHATCPTHRKWPSHWGPGGTSGRCLRLHALAHALHVTRNCNEDIYIAATLIMWPSCCSRAQPCIRLAPSPHAWTRAAVPRKSHSFFADYAARVCCWQSCSRISNAAATFDICCTGAVSGSRVVLQAAATLQRNLHRAAAAAAAEMLLLLQTQCCRRPSQRFSRSCSTT